MIITVFGLLLCFSCSEEQVLTELPEKTIYLDPVTIIPKQRYARLTTDHYELVKAELLNRSALNETATVIIFMDQGREKAEYEFEPGLRDSSTVISYFIDPSRPSTAIGQEDVIASINASIDTWAAVSCSSLDFKRVAEFDQTTGYAAFLFGFDGDPAYVADINHVGFMPGEFFDMVQPNGAADILGITFTFAFRDNQGELIDSDNDGLYEVAFREIYYNDMQPWNQENGYDFQTIALHETGHGLSQGHFGKGFFNRKTGKVIYAPQAVMNASYSEIQRELTGPDKGGHCSLWSSWPSF